MTEEDRRHARAVLERGWLSIDDIAACKDAVESTGLPFLDVARAKGFLTPERIKEIAPPPMPRPTGPPRRAWSPFYVGLLVVAGVLLLTSEVYLRIRDRQKEDKFQRDIAEARQRADEQARQAEDQARRRFSDEHRSEADGWLKQGRILLLHVEETMARNPKENLDASLKEAIGYYCLYLESHPGEPDALFERAQVYLYRKALPEAERDLDAACKSAPERAAELRSKFGDLRRRLGR